MFTNNSRYYRLRDIVLNNKSERQINSKTIRQIPDVLGTFQHVVDDNDRLDLLASKYYSQPLKWWRICDANPDFKSPLDLLGKGIVKSYRFRVLDATLPGPMPWLELSNILDVQMGVEAKLSYDKLIGFKEEIVDVLGDNVTFNRAMYERYLDVRINTQLITSETIASLLASTGFVFSAPELLGRVGKKIIIPPVR